MAERQQEQQEREWIEFPETFEDMIGCDMCGAHIDDPCDCFDSQQERRYRTARETLDG